MSVADRVHHATARMGWHDQRVSMVLYSRLTIILESHKARRSVLGMIISNAFVWHTVMITVLSGMRTTQYAGRPSGRYPFRMESSHAECIL